jgi:hypothetical protein
MSSPVAPPPVAPPRRRRSFAGPFVLIVLGVVLLLTTLNVFSVAHLFTFFARFWPVLLILWGAIKLLEYWQAQRDNVAPPSIGAGGMFLIIVLVIGGLISTKVAGVNWGEVSGDNDFPFEIGNSYDYDDSLSQDLPATASLKIVNDRGAINVSDSNDANLHVSVHKKIRAENQKQGDEWNEATKPQITVNGSLVTVNANTQGAGSHPITTDLDIAIPRKIPVNISTKKGDVTVIGRDGNVDVSSRKGDVNIEDIAGTVNLNLDDSSARVAKINGDVAIDGRSNTVSLADVKGSARLNGDFMESLQLSRISKNVSFKSSRTEMEFAKLDGDLNLDKGDLRADKLLGPLRLTTRAKDINLDGISGDARVQNENGGVDIQLAAPGNVQIDNRQGDIKVGIPGKAGFRVDARVRGGEIQSDFDALKVTNEDDRGTASGTVGNGAIHLVLNNEHGSIEIRNATENAAGPVLPVPPAPPSPHSAKPPKSPKHDPDSDMEPTDN